MRVRPETAALALATAGTIAALWLFVLLTAALPIWEAMR